MTTLRNKEQNKIRNALIRVGHFQLKRSVSVLLAFSCHLQKMFQLSMKTNKKIFRSTKISFLATSRNKAGYGEDCDDTINKPCTPAGSASESLFNSRDWNEVDVFSVTI